MSIRVPVLTILYHPRLDRIGEQHRMQQLPLGKPVALSRLEPEFAPVGAARGGPMADPRISRRPVWLERSENGAVRIDISGTSTRVAVDGVPVDGYVEISSDSIAAGAVIELGSWFVLLLHSLGRPYERTPRLGLVGDNEEIERLRGDIMRVADLDVPCLLRGESGTGKEVVARAIHVASLRAAKPWITVNMGAINRSTAASELFGHVRGAFTGADRNHDGLFSRADGGTLFLDEIGETPPDLQVMLLRVLETGEITPVGGSRSKRVDVRLIAATDSDLERATRDGSFRLPLLHRLSGYEVTLPPLRQRRDDIARLFLHFLKGEVDALGEAWRLEQHNHGDPWFPAVLLARLAVYSWPGNVRQLRNVARQLVINSRGADVLRIDTVERLLVEPEGTLESLPAVSNEWLQPARPATTTLPPRKKPSDITEDELIAVLVENHYKLGPTAKALRMSRTTLYAMIDRSPRVRKARDLTLEEIEVALLATEDIKLAAQQLEVSARGLKLRMNELGLS